MRKNVGKKLKRNIVYNLSLENFIQVALFFSNKIKDQTFVRDDKQPNKSIRNANKNVERYEIELK